MLTIHKYHLSGVPDNGATVTFKTPAVFQPLHVGMQHKSLMLWAHVDDDSPDIARTFEIVGTGCDAPSLGTRRYLGTVFDGVYVWHVFQRILSVE